MSHQVKTPSGGDRIGAGKALGNNDHILAQAAGSMAVYYVAKRDPRERLSGEFATRDEGLRTLAWVRRRHPAAQLVRRLTFWEAIA